MLTLSRSIHVEFAGCWQVVATSTRCETCTQCKACAAHQKIKTVFAFSVQRWLFWHVRPCRRFRFNLAVSKTLGEALHVRALRCALSTKARRSVIYDACRVFTIRFFRFVFSAFLSHVCVINQTLGLETSLCWSWLRVT